MTVVKDIVQGVATPLFGLIDKLFTSDQERAEAKMKLIALEQAGELETIKARLSAILAEAQSDDKWTSRARPSFLYVMYAVIGLCFLGGMLGIWWPDHMQLAARNIGYMLASIPEPMWWVFGVGYTGYTGFRTVDKFAKSWRK